MLGTVRLDRALSKLGLASRTGFDAGPLLVLDRAGPVLSLEVGPNRRIYFSDFGAVYRLAPA